MARAIWRGDISFGLVSVPVALFSAENRDTGIQAKLFDARNDARVREKRVNEETGKEVPWEDVSRGFEYGEDRFVVLSQEELESVDPKKSRAISIVGFVKGEEIDPVYYAKPYYLQPEERGAHAYAILRDALKREEFFAIARFVLRTREHVAALRPYGEGIVLQQLRYSYEVRNMNDLSLPAEDPKESGVTEAEIKMAEQLIGAMVMDWDPEQYKDTYRDELLGLIKRKAEEGAAYKPPPPPPKRAEPAEVVDIMSLLKQSVAQAKPEKKKEPEKKEAVGAKRGA